MPYGHTDDEWAETKHKLRAFLITKARNRSWVSYSQVVAQIGPIQFLPDDHGFHRMLDEVSVEEDEQKRGLLTVIVVHKDGDMRPGPGFFDLAARRGRKVVKTDTDKTWISEMDTVVGYWKDH